MRDLRTDPPPAEHIPSSTVGKNDERKRRLLDDLDRRTGRVHAVVAPGNTATSTVYAALLRSRRIDPLHRAPTFQPQLLGEPERRCVHFQKMRAFDYRDGPKSAEVVRDELRSRFNRHAARLELGEPDWFDVNPTPAPRAQAERPGRRVRHGAAGACGAEIEAALASWEHGR